MATKTIASNYTRPPADSYHELIQILPPRPIHDRHEYEEAVAMVGNLVGFELNEDQEDYLTALDTFIQQYESDHPETGASGDATTGLDALRFLLEENGMTGADLSRILRGTRNLTIDHARKLGERFKVDPGLFIR